MVSKAADAAVWEDLKDIKPPMYDGNPLNLDRFLEKLADWGLTVTEDLPPADAEKYVFKRFRYRLPEVLGELYFMATKEGKIKTLKEAKKWLNEQERVDAPQVAAKRWKSIKLEHDGREIRLREWRDFRGKYTLFRRNVEDWNEGDEQARLLSMLPEAWIKRVTKEESKRAKSGHTVKMMLPKEYHTNVVAWAKKNVARDVKRHSLRNALLITVSGDREKTAMWRLDDCELSGQTIRLQPIPAQMSCDEILEWVGEEVLKEYRNLHHTRGLRPGDRDVNYVGEGPGGEDTMDPAGAGGDETLVDDDDDDEPAEVAVCAFVAGTLAAEAAQGAKGGTPAPSPQRANGGHHPGSTTLGDYIQVAQQTQAKPRPLLLRARQAPAGPSSEVESAHRGRMPADQASSSSSVAPERDVARACESACGVPCNRRVARQRAKQYSAAVEGAAGIAQEEAAEWAHGMAVHTQSMAAIAAGLTAVAAHGAATAQVNGELAAADEEARLTQEAIACKEVEVKALEEALGQERAKKEAEERAHAEATAKAQEDAAKKEAIGAARRKVAEEKAKTEAELAALEAQKAQLQQAREAEAARAREEAEARAAAATAAAMEEAEAKLRRDTPPGGSRVETLESFSKGTPPPG